MTMIEQLIPSLIKPLCCSWQEDVSRRIPYANSQSNLWAAFHLIRLQEIYLTEWLSCSERKVWIAETFLWYCCVRVLFIYLDVTSVDKGIH